MYFQGTFALNPMPALDSVEVPELPWAWFAEGPEGAGRGSRNLPIKSWTHTPRAALQHWSPAKLGLSIQDA